MSHSKTSVAICLVALLVALSATSEIRAHQWSSTMGEARALERAAKDLHKVVDRTHDAYAARITAGLADSACALLEQLNRAECAEEVLASQSEVGVWFERIAATVDANPLLKDDGRVTSALERTVRHFTRLDERIRQALWSSRNRRAIPLSPWDDPRFRQPAWVGSPASPGVRNQRIVPRPVSPGNWHYTNVPGAIPPGAWHQSNVPGYVTPGAWHQSNVPGYVSPGSWHHTNTP